MSPPSDTSLDCLALFMSGLPCFLHLSLHLPVPLSVISFPCHGPPFLSFPVAPFSVPVCLSLQELPPSSVYQPWGSGTPGALTSATAPPPGSTRWPRRYQQQLSLPDRHICSHTGPWVAGHRAHWGQESNWGDKRAGLGARTVWVPSLAYRGKRRMGRRKGSEREGGEGPSRLGR